MIIDELFTGELVTGVPSMDAALLDKMPGARRQQRRPLQLIGQ